MNKLFNSLGKPAEIWLHIKKNVRAKTKHSDFEFLVEAMSFESCHPFKLFLTDIYVIYSPQYLLLEISI